MLTKKKLWKKYDDKNELAESRKKKVGQLATQENWVFLSKFPFLAC